MNTIIQYIPYVRDIDFEDLFIRSNEIDFKGQKKCENYYWYIIFFSLFLGLIIGMCQQRMVYGVITIAVGTVVGLIVCVPAWPMYKKNPKAFLEHHEKHKTY